MNLYTACLAVVRDKTKKSATKAVFDMLYYAQITQRQMIDEIHQRFGWIQRREIREVQTCSCLRDVPVFPLVDLFELFQKTKGAILQNEYNVQYNHTSEGEKFAHPYRRSKFNAKKCRNELCDFTRNHKTEHDQLILNMEQKAIALMYLKILDRYLDFKLFGVHLQIDSASRNAMLATSSIEDAMYLWVFMQAQAKDEYKTCIM